MNEMLTKIKKALAHGTRNESGQAALAAALILLVVGSLVIPSLLGLMYAGLTKGKAHESKLQEFYAADAGVEDAMWQIKNDQLSDLLTGYDPYEYGTPYAYPDILMLNDKNVDVTIKNVWIPKGIDAPNPDTARLIAEGTPEEPPKLIIVGTVTGEVEPGLFDYQIKIFYYYDEEDELDALKVETIGIWLPPGFDYEGNCSLADDPDTQPYSAPDVDDYCSGKAVVWDFSSVLFKDFPDPGAVGYPTMRSVTFQVTSGQSERSPGGAMSWIETTDVPDISFAWDADTKVYKIDSVATDPVMGHQSAVEAYTSKTEVHQLGSTIAGDYFAVGNSLLTPTGDVNYRNRLYEESGAAIAGDDIPSLATVEAAFLYWTGWIDWHGYEPSGSEIEVFYDNCTDLYSPDSNWDHGSDWHESGSYTAFYAHHEFGGGRELTLKESLPLTEYSGQTVNVSWRNWNYSYGPQAPDDCFQYRFSGDGGSSWSDWTDAFCNEIGTSPQPYSDTIPEAYLTNNFKIQFRIQNYDGSDEYVYIDNVSITVPSSGGGSLKYPDNPTAENLRVLLEETARVNKVMFGTTTLNADEITAKWWQLTEGTDDPGQHVYEDTWSYCCLYDATELVEQWIEDEDIANNGAGTYTLGHVVAPNEEDPDFSFELYPSGEETGYPLGTPAEKEGGYYPTRHNYCHAGWSLIIIYTSPETKGHQLYLYDIRNPDFTFIEAWHSNPDFDGDGEDGGTISGFLVPEPIEDEVNAARLTVFVGEGDSAITGDYLVVEGEELSNDESPSYNVWNSESPGLEVPGIDIDTFCITWGSGILQPGDTSAQVDMPTGGRYPPYGASSDGFNTVYIILSFRSDVTTGGTLSYLLR